MTSEATSNPSQIGRYQIAGRLATGGMAEIFLAVLDGPGTFRKPVVIKRMLPRFADRPVLRQMFLTEACSIASFQHPNLVAVFELGTDDDELFLVMEYLAGEHMNAIIRRLKKDGRQADYNLAAGIIHDACRGLHYAHEVIDDNGIPLELVHRDVSPENIFITYDGAVKVIDFGLVQSAALNDPTANLLKGKPHYMSPEQTVGSFVDRRSDIFALGILLFEMTTGRQLFRRSSDNETFDAVRYAPIPRPSTLRFDYPPMLEAVCLRALDRDVNNRYQTCAEMAADLAKIARGLSWSMAEEGRAQTMAQLFSGRRKRKQELLSQVEGGTALSKVEVGDSVRDRSSSVAFVESAPSQRPRRVTVAALAIGALAAAGLLYAGQRFRARADVPPVAHSKLAPSDATNAKVELRVETLPPGAKVRLGDTVMTSPATSLIERSTQPSTVEISRPGYQVERKTIVLDRDHALLVQLVPEAQEPNDDAIETQEASSRSSSSSSRSSKKSPTKKPSRPRDREPRSAARRDPPKEKKEDKKDTFYRFD